MASNNRGVKVDSCCSWLICCGNLFCIACTAGFQVSYGIIYSELLLEFRDSRSKTALVGSLTTSLTFFLAPLTFSLGRRFGEVNIMFGGVAIIMSSLLLSSMAKNINHLIVSFGILHGVGSACLNPLSQILLPRVFDKKLGTALGIGSCGIPFGTLVFTPILNAAFKAVGWRTTFQILTGAFGFILVLSVCPFLLIRGTESIVLQQNISTREVWEKVKLAVKIPGLRIFTVAMGIAYLEHIVSYTHQIQFSIESGVDRDKAARIPLFMAIANAFGRVASGLVFDLDFLDPLYLFQFTLYSAALISFLGQLAKTYVHFLIYFVSLMIFNGAFNAQHITAVRFLVGKNLVYEGFEVIAFVESIPIAIGPFLLGFIVDKTEDYSAIFYMTGTPLAVGATLTFLCRCIKTKPIYRQNREPLLLDDSSQKRKVIVLDHLDERDCLTHKVSVL